MQEIFNKEEVVSKIEEEKSYSKVNKENFHFFFVFMLFQWYDKKKFEEVEKALKEANSNVECIRVYKVGTM